MTVDWKEEEEKKKDERVRMEGEGVAVKEED
jgi:hypothetical protein